MSTVWVVHDDRRFDLSGLDQYGTRRVLFTRELFPDEADPKNIYRLTQHAVSILFNNYDQNADWIALVGAPVYVAMVGWILGLSHFRRMRLLRFDRRDQQYCPIVIPNHVHGVVLNPIDATRRRPFGG